MDSNMEALARSAVFVQTRLRTNEDTEEESLAHQVNGSSVSGSSGAKSAQVLQNGHPLGTTTDRNESSLLDTPVAGYDFNKGLDYEALLQSYLTTGFQATHFGLAVQQINAMLAERLQPCEPDNQEVDPFIRRRTGCTIFLGYTSNMASCGVRDTIRFLVQHRLVDALVTTAGGVEEDLIKCLAPTFVGSFNLSGSSLRKQGLNRIGNLLVPNENYCKFEDWLLPILDKCLAEQKQEPGHVWTPSRLITRLGQEINCESSIAYWAAKNEIPIFCPALTDGSLGDMLFFHSYRSPGLVIDIVQDIRRINTIALKARRSGMVIVGGGLVKHHIANANLMRNGADYAVYLNTASEYDGSDSGASPDEAVSWGKIKAAAQPVKITAEATLIFPLLVAQTFVPFHARNDRQLVKDPTEREKSSSQDEDDDAGQATCRKRTATEKCDEE